MNVAERVRKLLALAEGNANPAEAEAAALAAQRLMVKYGVVLTEEESRIIHGCSTLSEGRFWRYRLAGILAGAFRCRSAIRGTRPVFFGAASDVEVVISVHSHLYSVGDRYARAAVREYRRQYPKRSTTGVYDVFVDGFLEGINSRLSEQSRALMVIVPKDVDDYAEARINGGARKDSRRQTMTQLALQDGSAYRIYSQGHERGRGAICQRLD